MLQDILNSPFPVAILSLIVLGGAYYGHFVLAPKLRKLEEYEEAEKNQVDQIEEALLKVAELHKLVSVTNDILIIANKANSINEHFVKIEAMLTSLTEKPVGGLDADTTYKIVAILEKVDSIVKVTNKHPDNLEVMLSDFRRTIMDIQGDCDSILQNTSTISSHLYTTSTAMGNERVSLQGLKK